MQLTTSASTAFDGEISFAEGPVTKRERLPLDALFSVLGLKLCNNLQVRISRVFIWQSILTYKGINVTSYYLPTVLIDSVGLSNSLSRLLAACNSVSYLVFSLISIPNVERWGRRRLMMYAAAGQCLCYLLITILLRYNSLPGYAYQQEVASASVAFFFLYYVFFGIGWQGVPWLYPTEINSLSMRTKGAAIGTASNWIFNFMVRFLLIPTRRDANVKFQVVEITPIGIKSLGWRFYIIWTVFNASFVPIVYFFYPETAGRTLEDMDRLFRENHHVIISRDKDAISPGRPATYIEAENEMRHSGAVRRTSASSDDEEKKMEGGGLVGSAAHVEN